MMKYIIAAFSVTVIVPLLSCGSTGPSDSDLTPSTLSVTFTGSTDHSTAEEPEALDSPLQLKSSTALSNCQVLASWTMCTAQDYSCYVLFRSETPGISSDTASAERLTSIYAYQTTSYVDNSVSWDKRYYYAMMTSDGQGGGVWSNEEYIDTPEIDPPAPSILELDLLNWDCAGLEWTLCPDLNFENYVLYRSTVPGISSDPDQALVMTSNNWRYDTLFQDYWIEPDMQYYYAVRTKNSEEMFSWSNEISVMTLPPVPTEECTTLTFDQDPWDAAVLPSGEYVYITFKGGDEVRVLRTSDNAFISGIYLGNSSYDICCLPNGDYVYVSTWGSNTVSVIRTSDNQLVQSIEVGSKPTGICALPQGDFVYVSNRDDGTLSVIDTSSNSVVDTVTVGTMPFDICSDLDGNYLYVTNWGSGDISVVRTSDNALVSTLDMPGQPVGLCPCSSGDYIYATDYGSHQVAVIGTSTHAIEKLIDVGAGPWGLCLVSDCLFSMNSIDNTLSMISIGSHEALDATDVGQGPSNGAALPSGEKLYVMNFGAGSVSVLE